jgi:hypothetical protein
MVLGHYGLALAAKRLAPRTCLGWLLAAAAGVDLIWPIFLLLGIEHVRITPGLMPANPLDFYDYPITHSLVGGIGWGIVFAAVYFAINRDRTGAWVIGALVVSHWFLDAMVHGPDLPIYPGGPKVGLGLWNSVPGTLIAEAVVFGAGIWVYVRTTVARGKQGEIALWSFVIVMSALYLVSSFAPPPPDVRSLAWAALAQWIIAPWGWWIDSARRVRDAVGRL